MKEYAALIGIDWANAEHAVCLSVPHQSSPQMSILKNTPEALHKWCIELQQRFKNKPIAIALEQSRGSLIHALMSYAFIDLYPVNPLISAQFRRALKPSGAKSDPSDALMLVTLLEHHRHRLYCWEPEDAQTRKLALLCEARRKMVDMRSSMVLMLKALLKGYFPQALELLGDQLSTPMACNFLLKWPSMQKLKGAHQATVRSFYYLHNVRSKTLIEKRLKQIHDGVILTDDEAILDSSTITAQTLARQLRTLHHSILKYDHEIQAVFEAHQDAFIYKSLPGAGEQLGPRLLSAMGRRRNRWANAGQIQRFSGIAPVVESSGQKNWTHFRWRAPRFVRQSFHEFARCSLGQSIWAKKYYDLQRERGKSHQAATRALAFKWIRIIYKCWKEQAAYDEATYLSALQKAGSPLSEGLIQEGK